MSNKINIALVLLAFACAAIPVVHSNEEKSNEELLIRNNTERPVGQEVKVRYTKVVQLTPIPTSSPKPISTPKPVVSPTKPKVTVTPTPLPTINGYDFRWAPRTALDYTQADKEHVKRRICAYFTNNCNEALIIASSESGFRSNAASSGYFATADFGVMQLNCRWQKNRVGGNCLKFLDLETNLRIARQIYLEQGWKPWSTRHLLWELTYTPISIYLD